MRWMLIILLVMGLSVMGVFAQEDTLVDVAIADERFTTLVSALEAADLVDVLEDDEYTVFAPTDGGFETLLSGLELTVEDLLADTEALTDVLTYHVVEGRLSYDDLASLASERNDGVVYLDTVNGETLKLSVDISTREVRLAEGTAFIIEPDVQASNGIIHVIDNVLLPPADDPQPEPDEETAVMDEGDPLIAPDTEGTIADLLAASNEFEILTAALEEAELLETLNDVDAEFTVFAPTDQAFRNLLVTVELSEDDLLASDMLADILLYHVSDEALMAEDLVGLDNDSIDTLLKGNAIAVRLTDEDMVQLNRIVDFIEMDIEAENGVIHIIDNVLLPEEVIETFGL